MAVIAITQTPVQTLQQLSGRPIDREGSYLPRAILTFSVVSGVIAAKIATNTQTVTTSCTLPPNFAYQLVYSNFAIDCITAKDAEQFNVLGQSTIVPIDTPARPHLRQKSEGASPTSGNTGDVQIWSPVDKFPGLIFTQSGESSIFATVLTDDDAVNAADARRFFCTVMFHVYDISQVLNVGVNAPLPVRMS